MFATFGDLAGSRISNESTHSCSDNCVIAYTLLTIEIFLENVAFAGEERWRAVSLQKSKYKHPRQVLPGWWYENVPELCGDHQSEPNKSIGSGWLT